MRWFSLFIGKPDEVGFKLSFKNCALENLLPLDAKGLKIASVEMENGFLGDDVCAPLPGTFSLTAEDLQRAREGGQSIQEMALSKGLERLPLPDSVVTVEDALEQIKSSGSSPHLKWETGVLPSGQSYFLLKILKCHEWGDPGKIHDFLTSSSYNRGAFYSLHVSFRECEFETLEPLDAFSVSCIRSEGSRLKNPYGHFPSRFCINYATTDIIFGEPEKAAESEDAMVGAGGGSHEPRDSEEPPALEKQPSLSERVQAMSPEELQEKLASSNILTL
jgi:hypothetical protein